MQTFSPTRFNPSRNYNASEDDSCLHQKREYEITRAIDTISLDLLLQAMVEKGHMKANQARLFLSQAGILQAHLLTENNRSLNF